MKQAEFFAAKFIVNIKNIYLSINQQNPV
jgi:hypothetical protein